MLTLIGAVLTAVDLRPVAHQSGSYSTGPQRHLSGMKSTMFAPSLTYFSTNFYLCKYHLFDTR